MDILKQLLANPDVQAALVIIISGVIVSLVQAVFHMTGGIEIVNNSAVKKTLADNKTWNPIANILVHFAAQWAAMRQGNLIHIIPKKKGGK